MFRMSFIFCVMLLTASASLSAEQSDPLAKASSSFATLDGSRIHYKSLGKGKTAVVFIHGWTCDLSFWRDQVPALLGKTRVVLVDLPGHGQSDKPKIDYTQERFARAVNAVLEDAGVDKAVLVGHSMGTPVARQFYRLYPDKTKALVSVDGRLYVGNADPKAFEQLIERLSGPEFKATADKFIDAMLPAGTTQDVKDRIKKVALKTEQHVAVSAMKGMMDRTLWKDDEIKVPVQAIMAPNPFWSEEYQQGVRRITPQLDWRMMEGVGHFPMMEKPAEFNRLLLEFLMAQGVISK